MSKRVKLILAIAGAILAAIFLLYMLNPDITEVMNSGKVGP
jgi:hypothetical protein